MLSKTLAEGLEEYSIGEKLRALRLRKKLGLVDLGKHTGLSPALLSKIENGKLFPTLPTLLRIAMVYGVGLERFFSPKEAGPVLAVVRTPLAAFDLRVAHSDELLRMCSWCKRVPIAERQWVEVEVAVEQFALLHRPTTRVITHGICPECEATVFGIVKEPGGSSVGQVELGLFA